MSTKLRYFLFAIWLTFFATTLQAFAAEKYIFIVPALSNPYWQTIKHGIEDGGKEAGVQLTVLSAVSDQAKEEHLNLCQAAISQKPAIIVLCTTTTSVALQCLREAQNHGIKVAILDAILSVEEARKAGINLCFSIGTDNVTIGQKAAHFVCRKLQKRGAKSFGFGRHGR